MKWKKSDYFEKQEGKMNFELPRKYIPDGK